MSWTRPLLPGACARRFGPRKRCPYRSPRGPFKISAPLYNRSLARYAAALEEYVLTPPLCLERQPRDHAVGKQGNKGEMFRPTIRAIGVCVACHTPANLRRRDQRARNFRLSKMRPSTSQCSLMRISPSSTIYIHRGDSGFHTHYLDMFYVVIQAGQAGVQNLGKPATAGLRFAAGTAAFGSLGGEPRVHRVVNGNESTYQIIVVQLRRTEPPATRFRRAKPPGLHADYRQ